MSREFVLATIMIITLIGTFGVPVEVPKVKASAPVYIRADGSIEPLMANITTVDNVTYTFTDNIYDTIVIEKGNITIDGKGYVCQGSGGGEGFTLSSINNVTIININIISYHRGIYLDSSGGNTFSNNTIINNFYDGIYLDSSGGNTFSNNTITLNGHGVYLNSSVENTFSNNVIINNDDGGVRLISSSVNTFSNNVLTENDAGIRLNFASDNNTFSNNVIVNNDDGVHLGYSSGGNTFSNNAIVNNFYDGVHLYSFSGNTFSNNTIINNEYGIRLRASSENNTFSNNTVVNNEYGVHLAFSSDNSFYHNTLVSNDVQFYTQSSVNVWDDGSKGNYWDDYGELDTNDDGVGESSYVIDANNIDRFPLIVPLGPIPIVWSEIVYPIDLQSNSTISRFQFNASQKIISFNVTGQDGTLGFCNLAIQNSLVQDLWEGNIIVLVDGKEPINVNNWTDATYTYAYFIYQHSEHDVLIIPEFSSFITSLFMVATLLVIIVYKRYKDRRKPRF